MTALTVNGTGPYTSWQRVVTFEEDLDESIVPDPPALLRAKVCQLRFRIRCLKNFETSLYFSFIVFTN